MKPKKRKDIVNDTATRLGFSVEDVDNIVYYYYKYVSSLIESLEHERIYINNFGTFEMRIEKLKTTIKDVENIIAFLEQKEQTMVTYRNLTRYKERLEKMKKMLIVKEEIMEKKRQIKIKKHEPNTSLEK